MIESGNSYFSFEKYEFQENLSNNLGAPSFEEITIGRSPDNGIVYDFPTVSRLHAKLRLDQNGNGIIYDLSAVGGVYINGARVVKEAQLTFGDDIFIMGLRILFMGNSILLNNPGNRVTCSCPASAGLLLPNKQKQMEITPSLFTKPPRFLKFWENEVFEIDSPPPSQQMRRQPLILTLGPSMTMALAMMASVGIAIANADGSGSRVSLITSSIMAVSMLTGAVLWPILMDRYQKKIYKEDEALRIAQYKKYILARESELMKLAAESTEILGKKYPSPQRIAERADKKSRKMWERNYQDDDFLDLRIGIGSQKFNLDITVQKEKFSILADELRESPKELAGKYKRLQNVPIVIPLAQDKVVGLIGEYDYRMQMLDCMAMQIAGMHGYDEVKMVFIYNEAQARKLFWLKNIPHVWSNDRSMRFVATNKDDTHEIMVYLSDQFREREESRLTSEKVSPLPNYVVFVCDVTLVEDESGINYLLDAQNNVGVSSIFIGNSIEALPSGCQTIIQYGAETCSIYSKNRESEGVLEFSPDTITSAEVVHFAKKVASMRLKLQGGNQIIPTSLSFLDMFKVGNVDQLNILNRWNESQPHKSLAALIGVKAGGEPFSLDIHEKYHGPHGLVAGMTGSGKSEFIQSFILSMAVNFHPHDVSFILIDYKGGGMANCFLSLPHLAGVITNLGGNQIRRSLISLDAELKRRQRLFEQANAKHIDDYQLIYKENKISGKTENSSTPVPLPHLVIVSDEFAELKQQQPEFMEKLVSTARIGRSLGVHLILATQKPAGVVNEQIWGNARFRICLKVLERGDSQEMLKRPEAASIKLPGRCYVQVGYNEIFDHMQSGYSGLEYEPTTHFIDQESQKVKMIDNCGRKIRITPVKVVSKKLKHGEAKTQLEAVIDNIELQAQSLSVAPLKLWSDPLPEKLVLSDIADFSTDSFNGVTWPRQNKWLNPVIGIYDDPENQLQEPLRLDIGGKGHVILYGMPGTGKTTLLQTLLYSLSCSHDPDEVNYYALDFGGRTMGYLKDDPHCLGVAFADEDKKVEQIFSALTAELEHRKFVFGEVNVGSIKAYKRTTGNKIPAIILVVDNYSAIRERYSEHQDAVSALANSGGNYGIYLFLTGSDTNAIHSKVVDYVKQVISLQLKDRTDYMSVVGQTNGLVPEAVKGRGLVRLRVPLEFQTAVALSEEDEAERIKKLQEVYRRMNAVWEVVASGRKKPTQTQSMPSNTSTPKDEIIAPTFEVDLDDFYQTTSGEGLPIGFNLRTRSLETFDLVNENCLYIAGCKQTGKTQLMLQLAKTLQERTSHQTYWVESNGLYEGRKDIIKETNFINNSDAFDLLISAINSGGTPDGRIFIFVKGFDGFFKMISDQTLALLEKILPSLASRHLYFVTSEEPEVLPKYLGQPVYKALIETKTAILLGGQVNQQTALSFSEMTASEKVKVLGTGQGYLYREGKHALITTAF